MAADLSARWTWSLWHEGGAEPEGRAAGSGRPPRQRRRRAAHGAGTARPAQRREPPRPARLARRRAAAELLPGIDEVITFDAPWVATNRRPSIPRPARRLVERLRGALRRGGHLHLLPPEPAAHGAARPAGRHPARRRHERGLRRVLARRPASSCRRWGTDTGGPEGGHEVPAALALARAAGHELPTGDDLRLRLRPSAAQGLVLSLPRPYVVVHPTASVPSRSIRTAQAATSWTALVAAGWHVVLTGAVSASADPSQGVGSLAPRAGSVTDARGRTTFAELAQALAGARCVVTVNSGPAHLAAAVGTPVVSLFSPVVPMERWGPWGVPCRVLGDQHAGCARLSCTRMPDRRALLASQALPRRRWSTQCVSSRAGVGSCRWPRRTTHGGGRMRILAWHVHGSWMTSFVSGRHDYVIPLTPDRDADGRGRAQTGTGRRGPVRCRSRPAGRALRRCCPPAPSRGRAPRAVDGPAGRRGRLPSTSSTTRRRPRPRGHPARGDAREPAQRHTLGPCHVTSTRWRGTAATMRSSSSSTASPTRGTRYTGEDPSLAAVVNEPVRRWRVAGTDLLLRVARLRPGARLRDGTDALVGVAGNAESTWPGRTSRPGQAELHAALGRHRAYLHPYRWTSLGLAMLEAMALGLPVSPCRRPRHRRRCHPRPASSPTTSLACTLPRRSGSTTPPPRGGTVKPPAPTSSPAFPRSVPRRLGPRPQGGDLVKIALISEHASPAGGARWR